MLSRLPISLAQLKTGNNSEKLKNEKCILCAVQKNQPKQSLTIWSTLFKHGNDLYEHQK